MGVEFANTRYDERRGESSNFLADPAELVRGWFGSYAALHRVQAVDVPARDSRPEVRTSCGRPKCTGC